MKTVNKRILIAGSTGAIGSDIARTLSKSDNRLVLHYHKSAKKAEALKNELGESGSNAEILCFDLSTASNSVELVEMAREILGNIDILIDASSIFKKTPFGKVSELDWDEVLSANLKSTFFLGQAVAKHMNESGGKIILFSDIAARKPYGDYLPYCISKAGVDALVRALAKILTPKISVNGIAPYVVTRPAEMGDREWDDLLNKMPMHRPTSTSEIVELIDFLCSDECRITGQIITMDGGRLIG